MKTAAYSNCFFAIKDTVLESPIRCEPFTIYFDNSKLEQIRDTYGRDLYLLCLEGVKKEMNF